MLLRTTPTIVARHMSKSTQQHARSFSAAVDKTQKREIHQTPSNQDVAVATPSTRIQEEEEQAESSSLMDRFKITAEVTVSKIFPAGFGWQTASVLADQVGFAADSVNFALATGLGDAVGVLGGHTLFYAAKKAITGKDIDMEKELHTGILLGSAAFCSGTAWQPLVDLLQGSNFSFTGVVIGTTIGCGTAFYGGLRLGRTMLPLKHVERPTFENSVKDGALSLAIGGATGAFVGTDVGYLPEQNWLLPVVGIPDGTADLTAAAIAGTSTSLGFGATQSLMNLTYPKGECWND